MAWDNRLDTSPDLCWLLQEAAEEAMYAAYHEQGRFVAYRYGVSVGVLPYVEYHSRKWFNQPEVFFVAMPNLSDLEGLTFEYLFSCRGRSDPK